MIEFDVETTGLQPYSGNNEAFLWIFCDETLHENAEAILFSPSAYAKGPITDAMREAWERIQAWFTRGKREGIRAWNAKFDRGFAEMAGCFDVPGDGMWHDGMLVAQAIDERRSVALKAVAQQLFGKEAADPQRALKDWLNNENKRRRKVEKDAEKAEAGKLKIDYLEEVPCDVCAGSGSQPGNEGLEFSFEEPCGACEGNGATYKNRKRPATAEEAAAVIEEAKLYRDPSDDTFIHANYSHVPHEIMEPYALEDVILTRKISDVYEQTLINKPDLRQVYEFERKAMDALFAIEKRGLPARQHEYRKLEQEVITNLDHLESKVMQLAEMADVEVYNKELERPAGSAFDFNPNSTPQILAALKARGADMSYMSQDKGTVSADADNLRAVDDELAAAILEFRSEYKVLSTYVRPMIGRSYVSAMNTYKEPFIAPDSRIHATYRQVGARTGRMSCADPNMQNQPRDDLRLRYNIVADEGYKLVAVDLSNIEMVLFAAYCGEGRLLKAVQNGEDLHVLTAKMLGLRDRKRPGGGIETARQLGKTYNFSRVYGGGLRTIRRQFRCSMDEARLLKKRFDDAYPEVSRLQARIQYRLEDDGYIQDKLISGRRFRVDPRDAYKATNYLVQGTAAALLKYAVIKLHEDGVPMVALVHDEIVAHVPERDAQEAANLIEARMTEFEGLKGIVPLRAEADIVERWSDAKPLKDDDGKPYLFTPKWAGGEKRYLPEAA
jgi:DNA polymerase I-like protein with 3'-5' exonuclease and polymerase domains